MDIVIQATVKNITDGLEIASYVRDNRGNQELVAGSMWHPVDIVNRQAWAEIDKHIAAARKKVNAGRASCLLYYMIANQMTPSLLAAYSGQSRWLVRLHLVPFFFQRLPARNLHRYAEIFKVTVDDLRSGRLRPPVYKQKEQETRSFA